MILDFCPFYSRIIIVKTKGKQIMSTKSQPSFLGYHGIVLKIAMETRVFPLFTWVSHIF